MISSPKLAASPTRLLTVPSMQYKNNLTRRIVGTKYILKCSKAGKCPLGNVKLNGP